MQALKNIGLGILGIGMLVGMAVVALLYLRGIAWVSERVFDYVALVNGYAFIISAFVFLPCAVFRATRKVAAFGLFAASMVFGITVWIFGLLVTYAIWGLFGVFIGLGLFGFGVVPLGMIAGGLHGEWEAVMQLVLGIILTLGARGIAAWLAAKIDEAESFRAAGHQVAPSY
jgi:hypothetical protein